MKLTDFADLLASEAPAPGGGSVSALCGALSASLSAMVANLTFDKKGFEKHKSAMEGIADRAQKLKAGFLLAVDDDMKAFNKIIEARRMAKGSDEEKQARENAIFAANKEAIAVPMQVLKNCRQALELAEVVIQDGNPNSLSDAGCAVLNAVAAAEGAYMNVLINASGLDKEGEEGKLRAQSAHEGSTAIVAIRKQARTLETNVFKKLEEGLLLEAAK